MALRPLFCIFLSGRLRQVSLYISLTEDYKDLVTDTLMNPKSPVSVARKGYCAASWSPKGGDDLDRYTLPC